MKKRYQCLLLCLISLLLAFSSAEALSIEPLYVVSKITVNQSEHDNREYRVIELTNGMKVLVISDPKAVQSSAALAIPVGSLFDPKSQQGLAHYTEHMLLMGSKKYPKPSDFAEYLSSHAGSYNASTELNRTAFYFEVENDAFSGALDRLADAIAQPLLDPKYADKERNAVNAELTMARSNDGFRIGQVDSETINQNHPAAMFSGGNLETLSDKPDSNLHQALVKFHQDYYLANNMVGILYSNQAWTDLANLAATTFGHIAAGQIKQQNITQPAMTNDNLGKIIYMEPAQPKKVLYVQFPIENNIKQFASKTDEYIAYLLGNRSSNTLFDQLQKQGLIDSISAASAPLRYGTSGVFGIYVNLTDQGLAEKDKVLASIFGYLELLSKQGVDEKYYREIQKVLKLEFNYPDITHDMSYVEYLADQMLLYPTQHILDADYVADNYNPNAIKARLKSLTLDRARIWLIAPNQNTDKKAYFVDAPYRIENITATQKHNIMTQAKQLKFSLPLLNPYIPDQFLISQAATDVDQQPNQAFDPKGNLFHFASRYFADQPKGVIALSLRNNFALDNAKNQVMFFLLNYLANRQLAPLQFQAQIAGMSVFTKIDSGMMIMASGFNQHLLDMVDATLTTYRKFDITDEDLVLAKSWYTQKLDAADHANSYRLAIQPLSAIAEGLYFDRNTKRMAIDTISAADLRHFREQLLTDSVPYMLTLGNLPYDKVQALYRNVKSSLNPAVEYHPEQILQINHSSDALITQYSKSSDNALLMGFVPKGYEKITGRNISDLLSQIISPWFYDQLRSTEQLGYAVFSLPITIGNSHGIGFLIQSNQYDPDYINQRYQAFYPIILNKLNALTDAEFDNYKQSALKQLSMPAETLDSEFDDYLGDYEQSNFAFDRIQKRIEQLKKLSKEDVITFFKQSVMQHDGLLFASQVIGNQSDKTLNQLTDLTKYSNAAELQQTLLKSP